MKTAIVLFGLFIIAVAGILLLRPKLFTDKILRYADTVWMHVLAAAVRIAMGLALVLYADQSRFPLTLQIIGWVAIVGGVILAVIPHKKFAQLVRWAFERFSGYTPIAAFFAVIFGGFLIYAVL